jgi:hypothetical protein
MAGKAARTLHPALTRARWSPLEASRYFLMLLVQAFAPASTACTMLGAQLELGSP